MRSIFVGSNGIRAGWRLAIFVAMVAAMVALARFAVVAIVHPHPQHGPHPLAPWFGLAADLPLFAFALIAAYVMSRIERTPMGRYGLPLRGAFGGKFWFGAVTGFLSISAVLAAIAWLHGVRFTAPAAVNAPLLGTGALYAISFLSVAFTEEFLFRGYPQATLAQGMGFWPAGALLSLLFAAAHASNGGETVFGIAQIVIFALVFVYALAATGDLWFAVGYHIAWDWGETFFYGVPDSGTVAASSLLHAQIAGPTWLTGGAAGPEASILTTLALLALVPLLYVMGRKRRSDVVPSAA